jgi:hypothetical protein
MSSEPFRVNVGDRIAQVIPEMYLMSAMVEINHIVSRIKLSILYNLCYMDQKYKTYFVFTYSQAIHLEVALDLAQLVFLMSSVSTDQTILNKDSFVIDSV